MGNGIYGSPVVKRVLLLVTGVGLSLLPLTAFAADMTGLASWPQLAAAYSQPEVVTVVSPQCSLPQNVAGTELVAERVTAYDGPFLEDGSDKEVTQVAALILRNNGTREISQAEVVLEQESRQLVFRAGNIPPGAGILVLESTGAPYDTAPYTACRGWVNFSRSVPLSAQQLRIEAVGMGTLEVTNLTDTALEKVSLYYKTWLEEPGLYVGGITYRIAIDMLCPGQSVLLQPYHFADGYSKVIKAKAE